MSTDPDPADPAATLRRARALHRAGKPAEARPLYEEVLAARPDDLDGLLLLALACRQTGEPDRAIELGRRAAESHPASAAAAHHLATTYAELGRWEDAAAQNAEAVRRDPDYAAGHQAAGVALLNLGRPEAALASFDRAIALKPDWTQPRINRGATLRRLGRLAEAIAAYDAVIALEPDSAAGHANRGNALMDLGRHREALASFETALALTPDSAMAHNNRGNALLSLKQPAAALEAVDRAIALSPDYAVAHYNRGVALMDLDRPAAALDAFERAIALRPQYVEAHNNRGHALLELQRHAEALASFQAAIALAPHDADFQTNYRHVLRKLGDVEAALADADRAVAADPACAEARFSRSLTLLTLGRFEEGWRDYEHRWGAKTFLNASVGAAPPLTARLALDATREQIAGRRVLLVGEQGIGDIVMFASMVPDVQALAATVALACEPRLHRLLAHSFPGVEILGLPAAAERLDAFDTVLPLGSLGRLFRNRPEDFPGAPYLAPDPRLRESWSGRLGPRQGRLRVGVSWRGGTRGTSRVDRSVALDRLAPSLDRLGVEMVSLQYGEAAAEAAAVQGLQRPIRSFPASEIDDFEDLAGLVLALDAVVSVQTALVHLSGAIGARALVMVPYAPEWRYAVGTSTMPWYGSVRLFRQAEDRDWAPVMRAVAEALCP